MKFCSHCNNIFPEDLTRCLIDGTELEPLKDPLIGKLIGGCYRIISKLASGGMGDVYKAKHEYMDREVAIKALKPMLVTNEEFRQRTFREARICATIEHRNIVEVFDMVMSDDMVCLVMELLDGKSLRTHLKEGRSFDIPTVLSIMSMTAEALACAHSLDVVHRDIKPSNILLVRHKGMDDFVKLLDFGIAYAMNEGRLTLSGTVMGTPPYMPPELFKAAEPTKASDIYSLACVIYKILTGRSPFQSPDLPDVVKGHLEMLPEPVATLRPEVPATLDVILLRMLEKRPEDRYQDAFELLQALKSSGLYTYGLDDRDSLAEEQPIDQRPARSGWTMYFQAVAPDEMDDTEVSDSFQQGVAAADELREIEQGKKDVIARIERLERRRRSTRRNITIAIHSLHADLARIREERERAQMENIATRTRIEFLRQEVDRALASFAESRRDGELDERSLELLAAAGEAATAYLSVHRRAADLTQSGRGHKETIADLKFQISELTRRIRELDEECGKEYDEHRRVLDELSARGEELRARAATAAARLQADKSG